MMETGRSWMKRMGLFLLLIVSIQLCWNSFATAEYINKTVHLWPVYNHYTYSKTFAEHSKKAVDISADKGIAIKAAIGGYVYEYFNGCENERGIKTGNCEAEGKKCHPNHTPHNGFCNSGFGNGLIIYGDDGLYYQYAHMVINSIPEKFKTNAIGANKIRVEKGDIIGSVGSSGAADGPHLHFEINKTDAWNGHINPEFNGGVIKYSATMDGKLDVNGYLDGISAGNLGDYGTFDIRVGNDTLYKRKDYDATLSYGTTYQITNVEANAGYEYIGKKSGELSGTIPSGETVEVVLEFARQGNLFVQGNLDGVANNSISGFGTFDVYIHTDTGDVIETGCTSYNKQWPRGTTYEVRNIRTETYKNYDRELPPAFSGTITSNMQSKVVLCFTSDGTVSTDWQEGMALPGNLDPKEMDIEYRYHYEQVAESSPGSDWVQSGLVRSEYRNVGGEYKSRNALTTSDTRLFVKNYYYHYCTAAKPNYANYEATTTYVHYDEVRAAPNQFYESSDRQNDNGHIWVCLKWNGGGDYCCRGGETCSAEHDYRNNRWYIGYVYQDRELHNYYQWTRDTGWVTEKQEGAASSKVRWRYKDGIPPVPPDEYVLTINGWLDGTGSDDLFGYGCFDLYVDGELTAKDCYGIQMTFDYNPSYSIENIRSKVGKKYDGVHIGTITGGIPTGNAVVTLSFTTLMDISEKWTEADSLPEGLDLTGCEVEYNNYYLTTGMVSPGAVWTLYEEGPVQYENIGLPYRSDTQLATSGERVQTGIYYFHWCGDSDDVNHCNWFRRPGSLDYNDMIFNVENYQVTSTKWDEGHSYHTLSKDGKQVTCWFGCKYFYKGFIYQDRRPYQINTYVRCSGWEAERDPQADFTTVRIRLKQYDVFLDANGGSPDTELYKYHGIYLDLRECIPERDGYVFTGWNTKADGTGDAMDADLVYTADEPLRLFAQWRAVQVTVLPKSLDVIEEEAFANTHVSIVRIPSGCEGILEKAFAECSYLYRIYIPASVTYIDSSAFDGVESFTIVGEEGSEAEQYASARDWITFETEP